VKLEQAIRIQDSVLDTLQKQLQEEANFLISRRKITYPHSYLPVPDEYNAYGIVGIQQKFRELECKREVLAKVCKEAGIEL